MILSRYAVRNGSFTLIIFLMIITLGVTTVLNMPRAEDPEIHAPTFPIVIVYPGVSARDIEDRVVNPLEKDIAALDDIKRIRTSISNGVAVIQVEYEYNSNVDSKYQEITREVNSERSSLPADIYSIEVRKFQPSDVNILQVALISENAPRERLQYYAEELQDELEKLPPLKKVEINGLPKQQVRVELNLEKMAQVHLPVSAVSLALSGELASVPGGSVDAGHRTFNVKTNDDRSLDDIAGTVVMSSGGKNILLKDIAKVYYGYEDDTYLTRLNGHRCVFVDAALKEKQNISKAQEQYVPVLEAFKKTLPPNLDMVAHFDQADNVNRRLSGLGRDFLIAILLVAVTLLPLGGRPAAIVMISIPLSLSLGIVLLQAFGYTLNQLSIVGLVVALGLLVDDSIVVVENIERWMLEGHSRLDATLKATNQIGLAVLGCTVTLAIAFMPLAMMPEGAGDFIRGLPLAVIFSIAASLLISLSITPFLASRLLPQHAGNPKGNIFMRALKRVIHGSYALFLDRALKRPLSTIAVALAFFGGALFVLKVIGFSLFPASEKPQFMVNITAPLQSNLPYTDSVTRCIEKELRKEPLIEYYSSNVGKGSPRVYYNVVQENQRPDFAQVFVQLRPNTNPADKLNLIQRLQSRWTPYPGARVEVKNFEQGPPVVAPVEVRLFGEDLDTLRALAAQAEQVLRHTPGTMYIDNPVSLLKSDLRVDIDKDKARDLGVPTLNIDQTVRLAVTGLNVGTFYNGSKDGYDVTLTRMKDGRPSLDAFRDLFVGTLQGGTVPLSQLADLRLESAPAVINHQEKRRVVSVQAYIQKGFLIDPVLQDVIRRMNTLHLPKGYSYQMGGEIESRQNSFGGFGSIIILTVFLFIAVLVLEFRTFKSTVIVLSVIPLGIVGAALALWVTGNTLSFVSIIGLIALAGIEVKNTILLVDFTNQLRSQGHSLDEAIRQAGEVRFLPIVLTSLTAIGGLTPIAVSTNPLISPLAIVLIGGLISSTLLSRIVTPVIYKLIPPKVE